jgi:hypothetical protein
MKRQVRIPSGAPWFGMAFVAGAPSCGLPLALSASPPRATPTTTSTHGPFAPRGLSSPSHPRYYGPIRQSRPHPLTSQELWLYRGSCPTTWSGLRSRPSLLWVSVPSTRAVTSTPGGESGPYPHAATLLHDLPHQNNGSAPPMLPTSASVGALLSTLLPVFALLRPARLLALLDRSDLERHRSPAAEDFSTRACPRKVTLLASRISLHGARGRPP